MIALFMTLMTAGPRRMLPSTGMKKRIMTIVSFGETWAAYLQARGSYGLVHAVYAQRFAVFDDLMEKLAL